MTLELWIGLLIATAVAAFFGGRSSASRRTEIEALTAEVERLTAALEAHKTQAAAELAEAAAESTAQAATVDAGIATHFEQSAALFGKLAHDYRAFLEHFSTSAQQLGLSEDRTRELIDQVAHPLLVHDTDSTQSIPGQTTPPSEDAKAGDSTTEKAQGLDPISAKVAEIEVEEAMIEARMQAKGTKAAMQSRDASRRAN